MKYESKFSYYIIRQCPVILLKRGRKGNFPEHRRSVNRGLYKRSSEKKINFEEDRHVQLSNAVLQADNKIRA
jgi:hypothetical protein